VRRRANIRTRITFCRGADLESGREFYLGVAPSLNAGADFISAWRRAEIQTRIPLWRAAELESGREFYLNLAPSWHRDADSTSA